MIDYTLHHAGDALGWFSIAWNPERPQHPEVAYAAKPRDATLAAVRKLLDAEEAIDLRVAAIVERVDELAAEKIEAGLPEAPASATDIDGIRSVLRANMNGVVSIDYVRADGTPSSNRRIRPHEIKRRVPRGGFMAEEYVVATDLTSDDTREFYLSRIGRASRVEVPYEAPR